MQITLIFTILSTARNSTFNFNETLEKVRANIKLKDIPVSGLVLILYVQFYFHKVRWAMLFGYVGSRFFTYSALHYY